ncbi:protein-glutamate methylesterase/protein-glutamine glutaminase [Peribacillus deserti]|uniref:Protein-glutamate methylesterase/protein-glutamine glutaminase n=1 Tax=Peribacillus deserti TaxID=673318 RepID=A0A2N5MB38_9BACI|nr:chemotaxis response regulator protein-glutamate methylesterase [Peribacillus deserti]PLT31566.1 chemotaxis response regulator protein-glutamate methylesterase [Peribacillus deserti]
METIKVLVVDDSAFMRKLITGFLSEHARIEVAGTARNGKDAIEKVKALRPDVVTLDIEMPVMNGLEALENIMKEKPVPCIMLSSTTVEGAENTLHAISLGAFDFVPKPSGAISLDLHKIKESLIGKVLAAGSINTELLSRQTDRIKETSLIKAAGDNSLKRDTRQKSVPGKKIICIGTSTGGPGALQNVLCRMTADLDAPILIVQHMPEGFTKSLARRLDTLSDIHVKEAEEGDILQNGTAYIAPGGSHLRVKKAGDHLAVSLSRDAVRNGHRPSVDVMFESAAELEDYMKIAVIMTGMGNDGSHGLLAMKKTGTTKAIAESEGTSVVYGMPKAAIATRCVDAIEDVNNIAQAIQKLL